MNRPERRKYRRVGVRFNILCYRVGCEAEQSHTGQTVNVSPGGLYFQTTAETLKPGNLLRVELSIPPTSGLLEFGGRIAGFAKVLRTSDVGDPTVSSSYGIAVEFCQPLKLCP